ncbi:GWxTD domain-containing protein [candidate division KSB1 bacterium]|nr:GWxTD domain-containing protein [candidate division KSB1 bacterium]
MSVFATAADDTKKNWSRLAESVEAKPFVVDHINFIAQHNLAFVEFYVQLSNSQLSFTRAAKIFQAVYDTDFYIEDLQGNVIQTHAAHDTVRAFTFDETKSASNYRVTLFRSCLQPGEYRLRAIVADRETGKSAEVAQKFFARDFSGESLMVSDLQFSRRIQIDSSAGPFVKHNRLVEPNVLHRYGQFASQLFIYYEIYNLAEPISATAADTGDSVVAPFAASDSFRTHYIIRHENGDEIKQLWKSSRKPGNSCVQSILLPIADLKSGQYTLTVRLFDDASGTYAETSGRFSVAWSLFSFKDKKFEEILEQMRYFASRDELRQLKKLPEEDRQRGLVEFWQRRDPTPATPENELMDEYYRRLAFANRHFRWNGGEGWKSPQGEIYITYGPPDQINRWSDSPMKAANNDWMRPGSSADIFQETYTRLKSRRHFQQRDGSYEVWDYVQLNRRFFFADFRGMGSYELVDPLFINDAWSR